MNQLEQLLALAFVGALAALGKLLIGKGRLQTRKIIGSTIVGGCLGMVAAVILLQFPAAPFIVQVGIASGLSTLGYELFQAGYKAAVFKLTGKNIDDDEDK